eukprot:7955202-Alexandrium_andersonii.AAC.1
MIRSLILETPHEARHIERPAFVLGADGPICAELRPGMMLFHAVCMVCPRLPLLDVGPRPRLVILVHSTYRWRGR